MDSSTDELNDIDKVNHVILGDDKLVQFKGTLCDPQTNFEKEIGDGNYLYVIDTFFGMYGEFRIDNQAATEGELYFYISTHKR